MDGATASGLYCVSEDVSDFWASLRDYPDMTSVYDATGDRSIPVIAVNGGADVSVLTSRDGAVGTCYVNTDITSAQVVYEGEGSQRQAVGYAYIGAFVWSDDGTTRDIAWCWIVDTDVEIQDTATFTYGSETHTVSKGGIYLPRATVGFSGSENEFVTREYGVEEYTPILIVPYLTFSSPGAFTIAVGNGTKNWDGVLEYSTDARNWSEWDGTSTLSGGGQVRLYFRGSGNTVITGNALSKGWEITGTNVRCDGDIETLLDYESVISGLRPTMGNYCFYGLFNEYRAITPALISAPDLTPPTLAEHCYAEMFEGQTNLEEPAVMDAEQLEGGCCAYMYGYCTGLRYLPSLPVLRLPDYCYQGMFHECTQFRLYDTQTLEHQIAFRIPSDGAGVEIGQQPTFNMFMNTGSSFGNTPNINTTYYL